MSSAPPPSEDDETIEEVVVIGERAAKPTPEVWLVINVGGTGGTPYNDPVVRWFRTFLQSQTDFDIDEAFSAKEQEVIRKAIAGIANHPELAAAFQELMTKRADVNIRVATPRDQISGALGHVDGLEDGRVRDGARLDVFIYPEYGGAPRSLFSITVTIVHELVHALGVPAFTDRLHASGSTWDEELTRDIFRGYDFVGTGAASNGGLANVIGGPSGGGTLTGSTGREVFVGSDAGDRFQPVGGGNQLYPGTGANLFDVALGGTDTIWNGGGTNTLVMPAGVTMQRVAIRSAAGGARLAILIDNAPEVVVEDAAVAGSVHRIRIAGTDHDLSAFPTVPAAEPAAQAKHRDVFGAFVGGYIADASTHDAQGTALRYRLGSVVGAFTDEAWQVDPVSGALSASFYKPDRGGSEFSFVTVVAGNGLLVANVTVTVRWAYSNEQNPEL